MPWSDPPTSRSIACRGEAIKRLRSKAGWTQEDLAGRAGLSVRVVAKAELDGSLSPETIEKLADALSRGDRLVAPEELTTDPKRLALEFWQAYAQHEAEVVQVCRSFIAPDVHATVAGHPETNPIAGDYHGVDEFDFFFRKFFHYFYRPKPDTFSSPDIRLDGESVIVWDYELIQLRGLPPAYPEVDDPGAPITITMQFTAGKLTRFVDDYPVASLENYLAINLKGFEQEFGGLWTMDQLKRARELNEG